VGMLNSPTGNEGGFNRQPAMNIQRGVYNGGRYDAPERSLGDSISTSRVQIVKHDCGHYPPRHALYERSRSPKRRRILPNNDSWGVDPNIISISKSSPGRSNRAVPVPRFHSTSASVLSTAFGPRSSSYASNLSVAASSIASKSSDGRLSPRGDYYFTRVHYHREIQTAQPVKVADPGEEENFPMLQVDELAPLHKAAPSGIPPGSDDAQPAPSEASAKRSTGRPKIVYSLGDIVALKRKIPGSGTDGQDWIRGSVVKIFGEGKSRRYEVLDLDNPDRNTYRSSASQMQPQRFHYQQVSQARASSPIVRNGTPQTGSSPPVNNVGNIPMQHSTSSLGGSPQVPIPDEGRKPKQIHIGANISRLDNYEVGRSVLGHYPETTGRNSLVRSLAGPVTAAPSLHLPLAATDSKIWSTAFSPLSKVSRVARDTISQDNTQGDEACKAALLAAFGKKIR